MAWISARNNGQDRDRGEAAIIKAELWGNKGQDADKGPPDVDDIFRKLSNKLGGLGGGKKVAMAATVTISVVPVHRRLVSIAAAAVKWSFGPVAAFYTIKEAERGVVNSFLVNSSILVEQA